MRPSTVPLLLLTALVFFTGLGRGAITDSDEAFYAESAREMVESGDWLTPHYNYEPRFQKPILYYWLVAGVYLINGPTETGARAWSALAGLGLVLITAACARRWFDEETGLFAGAIAATNFGYFALARMALPDLPLAFLITLAIWAAFGATLEQERHPRKWLLLSAAAVALGCLMKGPIAVVIPALVVVPILLIERRSFNVRASDVMLATMLFFAIATPWYLAMWLQHGSAYLHGFFVGDNYERFMTNRFNDPRPWWFYLPIAAGGLLPWTPLVLAWVGPLLQFLTRRRDVSTLELRLLLWAILPLLFFTFSVGKQPRYILALLPPLAILLAVSIIERTRDWRSLDGARVRLRRSAIIATGSLLGGGVLIALSVFIIRARALVVDFPPSDSTPLIAAGVIGVAGSIVVLFSLTSAWRTAPAVIGLAAALSFCALSFGTRPRPEDSAVYKMAALVRQAYTGQELIGTYQVFVRNLIFYTRLAQIDVLNDDHLATLLAKHDKMLLVLPAEELARIERDRGWRFRPLGEVQYFDDGSIRLRALLRPDPSQDVQRVMLVTRF